MNHQKPGRKQPFSNEPVFPAPEGVAAVKHPVKLVPRIPEPVEARLPRAQADKGGLGLLVG